MSNTHHKNYGDERTACGSLLSRLGTTHRWTDDWSNVDCEACKEAGEFSKVDEDHTSAHFTVRTEQGKRICDLNMLWLREFVKKSEDYQTSTGNVSENFGLMGQYMKLTDKIHKLRKVMWDNEIKAQAGVGVDVPSEFHFESTEEILRDVIGHAFLALDFLEQSKPKKPAFRPANPNGGGSV